MGQPQRPRKQRQTRSVDGVWRSLNTGASRLVREDVASGEGGLRRGGGVRRVHPIPRIGDRFGELTVTGNIFGTARGGLLATMCQCSCGAPEHPVVTRSLDSGRTTRCDACAKVATQACRKKYFRYAEICPDQDHRSRLLNRISACIGRCHNPNAPEYENYGGRGIHVYAPWRESLGVGRVAKGRADFLAYLLTLDGWDRPELELDRIDVDKGYEPGNLRFVSRAENTLNKRKVWQLQRRIKELEAEVERLQQDNECLRHPQQRAT